MNGKIKGIVTENEIMTELTRHGIDVSIPRGDNAPYDLVADINGRLYKIQVKWPRFRCNGSFVINCTRNKRIKNNVLIHERYADTDVDYFATRANGKCYLVPASEVGTEISLRFVNDGRKGANMAADYELEKVVGELMAT